MRCLNCGSSAQLKVVSTEYNEDGWISKLYATMCADAAKNSLVYLIINVKAMKSLNLKKLKKGLTKALPHSIISVSNKGGSSNGV